MIYCPICGGTKFENLYGGTCSKSCVYCNKAINCRDIFTSQLEVDSIPVGNPFKAVYLRYKYNSIPGNKEKGKVNIEKNKEFWAKQSCALESIKKSSKIRSYLHRKQYKRELIQAKFVTMKEIEQKNANTK